MDLGRASAFPRVRGEKCQSWTGSKGGGVVKSWRHLSLSYEAPLSLLILGFDNRHTHLAERDYYNE